MISRKGLAKGSKVSVLTMSDIYSYLVNFSRQSVANCTCPGKETLFSGNMLYRCAIDMDGA